MKSTMKLMMVLAAAAALLTLVARQQQRAGPRRRVGAPLPADTNMVTGGHPREEQSGEQPQDWRGAQNVTGP